MVHHYQKECSPQRHREHRGKRRSEIFKFDDLEENIGFYKGYKILLLNRTVFVSLKSLCPFCLCGK